MSGPRLLKDPLQFNSRKHSPSVSKYSIVFADWEVTYGRFVNSRGGERGGGGGGARGEGGGGRRGAEKGRVPWRWGFSKGEKGKKLNWGKLGNIA